MSAYIADRDALVSFLHNEGDGGIWEHFDRANAETVADALIASGRIIDAATLADDEALSMALAECVWTEDEPTAAEYSLARAMLKALPEAIAAALTERAR